jgi:hypothetical protein
MRRAVRCAIEGEEGGGGGRHAGAHQQAARGAFKFLEDFLGDPHIRIVRARVDEAAAIGVVGIALERRGELDRRHDGAGYWVDVAAGLCRHRPRLPV